MRDIIITHTHTHIHARIHARAHMNTCTPACVNMCLCTYVAYVHTYIHTYKYIRTYLFTPLQHVASVNHTRQGPAGNITTLVLANPEGYSFELAMLSGARGLAVMGVPIIEYTWFEGESWSIVFCCLCIVMGVSHTKNVLRRCVCQ